MDLVRVVSEPAILIISAIFLFFILSILKNYTRTEKNLKSVYNFLKTMNKKEMSYRFNQLDEFMNENTYTCTIWEDFKKALIFPEKIYTATQNTKVGNHIPEIYLTVDASFFFNEETLVYSKINHKFIQAMPTLLTGLGPFFTFLKMAIAFTTVDLSTYSETSIGNLMNGIHIAALCSVFAVGYSLLFMFIEKNLYNMKHF